MMFFAGLIFIESIYLLVVVAFISGIGEALIMPALSALYLDITQKQHRSRVLGIKESAAALGGVTGPLLVASIAAFTSAKQVFTISASVLFITIVLTILALKPPKKETKAVDEVDWEVTRRRAASAQATFTAIFVNATTTRETRG